MTNAKLDREQLERVEGVVAVPPDAEGEPAPQLLDGPVEELLARAGVLTQAAPFLRSGWRFLDIAAAPVGLPVYRAASGRLYVMAEAMNVKFAPEASEDEIESVLQLHHLTRQRTLGFAPNLMTVVPHGGSGKDALQISRSLAEHPAVEFAEPVVIEELGGRS